jgi:WD40 repeat protein
MWHDRAVEAATFSPDGQYVATASDDGTAEVWDVRSGAARPNAINIGHTAYSVQFNPKGESVLVGSKEDGTARIWDPSADEPSHAIPYQTESSWPEFDAGGTAVLGVQGSTVRVWSTATWQPTSAAPMNHQGPLATARLSPDGARVATIAYEPLPGRGGMRRVVRLWDAATGTALQPLRLPDGSERLTFTWVEFSQDSQWIVAGADDNSDSEIQRGMAIVWNVARPDPIGEIDSRYAPVYFASLSPARDSVLTFGSRSTTALVWPVKPESALGPVEHEGAALGHDNAVLFAQFSADGHHIVTTSEDGTAKLWRYPIGASAPIVLQHKQPVDWAEFSADGKRVVTTARDGTARIWDANNGELAAEAPIDTPTVVPMARFSADGQRVATAAEDGWVRIWNVPYGTTADATPLADVAEAVSGYAVNAEGAVERIDHLARLDAERARHTAAQASTQSMAGRIAGWFFADRAHRPISPFSTKIAEAPQRQRDGRRKD